MTVDERRRRQRELGQLLRGHREHLTPKDVGIASVGLRRTPGLRREEVAALAGIGITWYSRLEMGQDVRPSRRTLRAVAAVLKLDPATLDYAFALVSEPADEAAAPKGSLRRIPGMSKLFETPSGHGVMLFDSMRTAIAWNALAGALLGYQAHRPWRERNAIWRAFKSPAPAELFGEAFDEITRNFVASFRRNGTLAPNPMATQLYDELSDEPRFADTWANYQNPDSVIRKLEHPLLLHHPSHGELPVFALKGSLEQVPLGMLLHFVPGSAPAVAAFAELARGGEPYVSPEPNAVFK